MEIIDIIQKSIGRKLSDEVMHSNISLYEGGVDSIELVKVIVELEKITDTNLDKLLVELETVTLEILMQEIQSKLNI